MLRAAASIPALPGLLNDRWIVLLWWFLGVGENVDSVHRRDGQSRNGKGVRQAGSKYGSYLHEYPCVLAAEERAEANEGSKERNSSYSSSASEGRPLSK